MLAFHALCNWGFLRGQGKVGFLFLFFSGRSETQSHSEAQESLELRVILLPQSP